MPCKQELPATLERSPEKAQRTWVKAHDCAVEEYGEGQGAHDPATFGALKRSLERVGDQCEEKDEKGRSDDDTAGEAWAAGDRGAAAGGVDANPTEEHLMERGRELGVSAGSTTTKDELVDVLYGANDRETRRSRS